MARERANVEIKGDNTGPMVFGGTNHGRIVGVEQHAVPAQDRELTAELLELLGRLRVEVAAAGLEKQAVIEDNLADLVADTEKRRDPATATEVSHPVTLSRWDKIKTLLSGLAQFAEPLAKISEHVHQLFGG